MAAKFKCHRCSERFDEDEKLADHLRSIAVCELRAAVAEDGINGVQHLALRSRKKVSKGMSELDKWVEVYKILFPDDNPVPSPIHDFDAANGDRLSNDSDVLRRFGDYAAVEFPRVLRLDLSIAFDSLVEERFGSERLVEITQNILKRLIQSFERQETGVEAVEVPNPGERLNSRPIDTSQHILPIVEEMLLDTSDIFANINEWNFDFGDWQSLDSGYVSLEHPSEKATR